MEEEILLTGGNSNGCVVKLGNTVRRELGKSSASVHRLLNHLENKGYPFSPRFLGTDDKNREILSFLQGRCEINASVWQSENVLKSAAKVLKKFHAAVSDIPVSSSDVWGYEYPDKAQHELICHNDFGLYNIVIQDDEVVGVIDFDLAGPGPRLRDVAYAAYWLVPLSQSAEDMKPYALSDVKNGSRRLKLFCKTYGIQLDTEFLDMVGEVLRDMANEKLMIDAIGSEQTELLKHDGHLDHWSSEAVAFESYKESIVIDG